MELIEFGKISHCKKIQSPSVRYSSCAGLSKSASKDKYQCRTDRLLKLFTKMSFTNYKLWSCSTKQDFPH